MKHLRLTAIALLLAVTIISLTAPGHALAASFTYSTDFNGFPPGWQDLIGYCGGDASGITNMRASVISGFGDGSVLSTQLGRKLTIYFELDEPATITHLGLTADIGSGDSTGQYVAIVGCESNGTTTHTVDAVSTGGEIIIDETISWADIESIAVFTAPRIDFGYCMIDTETGYSTTPPCHYSWIDAFSITADASSDPFDGVGGSGGGEILYRPVDEADTLEVSSASQPNIITTEPDVWVHAAASGVVTSVLQMGGSVRVTVENATYSAQYNNLAFAYAEVGDQITGGCVLGRTGDQILATTGTYSYPVDQIGFQIDDSGGPLSWQAWPDATSSSGCSDSNGTANCLTANPKLNNYADRWSTTGTPTNEEVLLETGERLAQYIVLTSGTEYYLTIIASSASGSYTIPGDVATIKYQLGDVEGTVSFDKDAGYATLEIGPITPTTPDLPPDVYALILTIPQESQAVTISFVCLHEGAIVIAPDNCYFADSIFWDTTIGSEWTLSAGAEGPDIIENFVSLPNSEYMSQPILLTAYTDADADYRLTVSARTDWRDVAGLVIDDLTALFSGNYAGELTATYSVSGTPVETMGLFSLFNIVLWQSYESEFTVPDNATWDGDIVLTNTTGSALDIELSEVCLSPVTGVWPGFENADSPAANPRDCQRPAPPETFNVAQWLSFIGQNIGYFVGCIVAGLLDQLLAAGATLAIGIGMLGRWLGSLLAVTSGFALGLAVGAFQALLNGLAAAVSAAWTTLMALPGFRWLYDLGSLLAVAASAAGVLIQTFLGLLGAIAAFTGVLLGVIAGTWPAIVGAINSTALDIGMANCGNPSDPLIGLCYGLQAVADVMAQFPAFSASFYVLAGNVGLFSIVWTTRAVGGALGDV